MNEEYITKVHIMLNEADTAFSTSKSLSRRTITIMMEILSLAIIMLFEVQDVGFAVAISALAVVLVFANLLILNSYGSKTNDYEVYSLSFKEKHLCEPSVRRKNEKNLYVDLQDLITVTERYLSMYKIVNIVNGITMTFTIVLLVMSIIHLSA